MLGLASTLYIATLCTYLESPRPQRQSTLENQQRSCTIGYIDIHMHPITVLRLAVEATQRFSYMSRSNIQGGTTLRS